MVQCELLLSSFPATSRLKHTDILAPPPGVATNGVVAAVPQIGLKALYEIAKIKNAETHSILLPLESVCKSVRATALSMGLEVVDDREALKEEQRKIG